MKRREFSLGTAAALAATGLALPAHAQKSPRTAPNTITLDKRVPVEAAAGQGRGN
jgi:thiol:disulfide interchange protein DsbA